MTVGVELSGLPQLEARLLHASSGVMDLSDANRDIAKAVESQARPDAPRATGRLAGSDTITVTADSWSIANTQPYAVPVHWGTRYMRARPWLVTAAQDTDQLGMLADHIQQLLDD